MTEQNFLDLIPNQNIDQIHNYGIDIDNRELYLHSFISNDDNDPGIDFRMTCYFIKNMRILNSIDKKTITVHMHSIGGNWNDGMAIYDTIKLSKSPVNIVVYGQAESMSSVVLQSGKRRFMMPNSYFMCHYGSFSFSANLLDVQNAVTQERKFANRMIDIYANRAKYGKYFSNKSINHIKNYIKRKMKDGDWYLDPQETIDHGFADEILK